MKTIRVKFVDFFSDFVAEEFFLYRVLSERYVVELSDTPDYLIFSVFGHEHLKYRNCIKIFWTGENQTPDFNFCDYAIGFDYLTFGDRYCRYPFYYLYEADYDLMLRRTTFSAADLAAKKHFCSFVYSNNNASADRKRFFDLLSAYKPVRSGGRYLNNVGGAVADKLAFQQEHKFAIAFENASSPGYTTEKLVQAFSAHTIPIYWGDPEVVRCFNPKSFVNCADYATWSDVVEAVKALDQDDTAYLAMMAQPPLNDMEHDREKMATELRAFLFAIFDQPLEQACRYNRTYWGAKLINNRLQEVRAFDRSLYGWALHTYMRIFHSLEKNNKSIWLWKLHKWLMKVAKR